MTLVSYFDCLSQGKIYFATKKPEWNIDQHKVLLQTNMLVGGALHFSIDTLISSSMLNELT